MLLYKSPLLNTIVLNDTKILSSAHVSGILTNKLTYAHKTIKYTIVEALVIPVASGDEHWYQQHQRW